MKCAIHKCLAVLLGSVGVPISSHAAEILAQTAEFQVRGNLLECACYLAPSSSFQMLTLGDLSAAHRRFPSQSQYKSYL